MNGSCSGKRELRLRVLSARRSISHQKLLELSRVIEANVYALPEYRDAKTLAAYVALADEVQTLPIIAHSLVAGKRVLVPKTDSAAKRLVFSELHDFKEIAPGQLGVLEPLPEFLRPVDPDEAELMLVPLVAWDERGYRLGYGKGYFDRLLVSLSSSVMTTGLALELQRLDEIPAESHDIPLRMIVTERRTIRMDNKDVNSGQNARGRGDVG